MRLPNSPVSVCFRILNRCFFMNSNTGKERYFSRLKSRLLDWSLIEFTRQTTLHRAGFADR
ncbi:hypothetical protein E1301_Tti023770 [Triplophysa tibetana]|uniref:Uncharacterized protein n=1 Tax=Triplophysa tibetana TaxID=1572043 RepID=A0A5A9NLT0_9TELE|nr:hypothetical protein E1301_Tti023770 [Triplophysa tibetana]